MNLTHILVHLSSVSLRELTCTMCPNSESRAVCRGLYVLLNKHLRSTEAPADSWTLAATCATSGGAAHKRCYDEHAASASDVTAAFFKRARLQAQPSAFPGLPDDDQGMGHPAGTARRPEAGDRNGVGSVAAGSCFEAQASGLAAIPAGNQANSPALSCAEGAPCFAVST